jgi:hypothetical protein
MGSEYLVLQVGEKKKRGRIGKIRNLSSLFPQSPNMPLSILRPL